MRAYAVIENSGSYNTNKDQWEVATNIIGVFDSMDEAEFRAKQEFKDIWFMGEVETVMDETRLIAALLWEAEENFSTEKLDPKLFNEKISECIQYIIVEGKANNF